MQRSRNNRARTGDRRKTASLNVGAIRPIYAGMADAGAKTYRREKDLPCLLPLWPSELADESRTGCERIVAKLAAALAAERRRARSRHWSYDLNRHLALLSAYRAEKARAASLRRR